MLKFKNIKTALVLFSLASFVFFLVTPQVVLAAPPRCFNFNGTVERPCEATGSQLLDDHCYTEVRGGPNGALQSYAETSCLDGTDRDQDGLPGGSTGGGNFEADCKPASGESLDRSNCGIVNYIVVLTNVLSALVGIVIVIMIAVGGFQYSTARDDPQAVSAAKNRIRNAIFALVIYLFGFAFLQYLVPGGIF